jgi:hypothetical protein
MREGALKRVLLALLNSDVGNRSRRFFEWLQYTDPRLNGHEHGNRVIREALASGNPQAMGKLGTSELFAFHKYLANRGRTDAVDRTTKQRQIMYIHAGLFPADYDTFERYAQLLLENVLPEMTVICPWYNLGEARIIKRYCRNAVRVSSSSLQACYRSQVPWTSVLAGRKVLVALPFERTVRQQYERRKLLWPSHPDILPDFELDTLRVPPHPNMVRPAYRNWVEALDAMRLEMDRRHFDVLLVGAGAYSLPLVVHAKCLGRQGVHLGGATQFLFGIMGRRWEGTTEGGFYNEHWSRPLPEETPANVAEVEGGCYW